MRLPSLLTAVWALASLYVFMRAKRVRPALIVATPLLASAYPTLWYYAGEARTYMPLVAGVLGVLAYYSLSQQQRSTVWGRTVGWGSILIGSLFHPYFLLYWPSLVLFSAWQMKTPQRISSIWRFANPPLTITGLGLGLAIGSATWLRGNIEQPVPWDQWLGAPLPKEILTTLFWPFMESGWLGLAAAVILAALILRRLIRKPGENSSPLGPIGLLVLAIALSLVVTTASVLAEFWVFPRQWIASQVLVLAALPWLASILLEGTPRHVYRRWLPVAVAGALLIPTMLTTTAWKVSQLRLWHLTSPISPYNSLTQEQLRILLDAGDFPSDRTWMSFSEANLLQGGPVWPDLGRYYSDRDWSSITLQQPARQDLFLEDVNP
jgi:hypothetical protein